MLFGWNVLIVTMAATAVVAAKKECSCVNINQMVYYGSAEYIQHPTIGGRRYSETCSMNCTLTATMSSQGVGPLDDFSLQVELNMNSLGDSILWIEGMDKDIRIDSSTPIGVFEAQSLNISITIEFRECPINLGEFELIVQMLEREDPGTNVSRSTPAPPPILQCDHSLKSNQIAMIVVAACGSAGFIAFIATILIRFRKVIFMKQKKYQPIVNAPVTVDEESGEFSSKFLNEFVVTKIRGVGGFGCVFEALNKYDHWEYAVKRVSIDVKDIETALREVRAMAQFDHPNIVRYNGTWVERPPEGWQHEADAEILEKLGSPERKLMNFKSTSMFIYIQMQLCNFSLSDWLRDHQDPSSRVLTRMKSWFKQMVTAVCYIHKKNLIHRDLKPSNILFAETDLLKLCDLGIVTERRYDEDIDTDITRTSIGTMLYMSPEQRLLFRYSSKSDVFTLGLIFAELCFVMTPTDRNDIFNDYRSGNQCYHVKDEKTAEFIEMITQVDPRHRPSSREMLDHLFLA